MNRKIFVPLSLFLTLVAGAALGWMVRGDIKSESPSNADGISVSPSDTSLQLGPNGNALAAKLILNGAEDRLHLLKVENRRWLGWNVLTMIREKKKLGDFPELANDNEADNPLMHNMNLASVVVTNTGDQPILILKGPGYMYQRVANFTRCHEIFVTRGGVPVWMGSTGVRPENIRTPYPDTGTTRANSDECALLYPKTSVKDPFWLAGPEFEFDRKTPATYRIKGRVTVCTMPKFEQVVLDTDEIEITVTEEHVRQYKARQPVRE